jgi:hypothetical protein
MTRVNIETGPEVGPEFKEGLTFTHDRTAESIDNVARMLARKAEKIDDYITMAALAPEGYSQVGRQSGSELYVEEKGSEPGEISVPTKIRLNGSNHLRASVSTESGIAEGRIENQLTGEVEHVLEGQDTRKAAALALWEKRRELRQRQDHLGKVGSAALGSVMGER